MTRDMGVTRTGLATLIGCLAVAILAVLSAGCITETTGGVQGAATSCSTGGRAGTGGRGGAAGMGGGGAGGAAGNRGTGGAISTGGAVVCNGGNGGSAGNGGAGGVAGVGGTVAGTGGAALGGNGGDAGAGGVGGMIAGTGGTVGTGGSLGTGGSAMGGAGGSAGAGGSGGTGGAPACGPAPVDPFYVGRYSVVMDPRPGMTFFAPASVHVVATALDPLGSSGGKYASSVGFVLDGGAEVVVTGGFNDDVWVKDYAGLAAGCHTIQVVAHYVSPVAAVPSLVVPFLVVDPGTRPPGDVIALSSDMTLTGTASLDIIGTPTARKLVIVSGGAHQINLSGTGHVNVQYADVIGVGAKGPGGGNPDVAWLDATTTGNVTIDHVVVDRSGPTFVTANGSATVAVTNSEFRQNALVVVDDSPNEFQSQPIVRFQGTSSAPKVFSGNNVAISFVQVFRTGPGWVIGGDTSAAGNVLFGIRAGFEIDGVPAAPFGVPGVVVRDNIIHNHYPVGYSQMQNVVFDINGEMSGPVLVEHNFLDGGSWILNGLPAGSVAQYNLINSNNENAVRFPENTASVQYNVFTSNRYTDPGADVPTAGMWDALGAGFRNNTVDAGGCPVVGGSAACIWPVPHSFIGFDVPQAGDPPRSVPLLVNNLFTGFAYFGTTGVVDVGALGASPTIGWNAFWNPDTTTGRPYSDGVLRPHDVTSNPLLVGPRDIPFAYPDERLWDRTVPVSQVLARQRATYSPSMGSPLINAGNAPGVSIGAIGVGGTDPADQFGTHP